MNIFSSWIDSRSFNENVPLIVFILGLLSSLGHAPYEYMWAFAFGVAGLLWRPDYRFKTGFLFGLGYWIGVLHWIIFAFDVYYLRRLGVISVFTLCSYLAVYKGFAYFLAGKCPFSRLSFCILWVIFEWIQGNSGWLSFPWGYAGFTWPSLEILQSTAWIGVYGMSLLTLVGIIGIFFGSQKVKILTLGTFIGCWTLGFYRLKNNSTLFYPVNLRLIQPCIAQKDKIKRHLAERNLQIHIGLSNLAGEKPLHAILWPETAFLTRMTGAMGYHLFENIVHKNAYLITGAPHKNGDIAGCYQENHHLSCLWNSVFVLQKGTILASYDKKRLVPFGEYNPLPFGKGFDSFASGSDCKVIKLPSLPPFRPFVCFEAIFPRRVQGEKWRLNLTNDAWYGDSSGPYQHFKIIQIRTIEANIPMVRVANNGISAVIDSYGRILSRLNLNRIGFIDFQLPR